MWNNKKKVVFPYVKLTNLLSFKLDFQKVNQHMSLIKILLKLLTTS